MNYENLIKNWHKKANKKKEDYFSRFIFEYLAFIAFLKKIKFGDQTLNDRQAIQKLKQDYEIRAQYLAKVERDQALKDAWEKIIQELDRVPLGNNSHNNQDDAEYLTWWNSPNDQKSQPLDESTSGKIQNVEDWVNMMEFWCSIRNNLFHGGKNPDDERDQLVVENGYKTLHPLVEILLSTPNQNFNATLSGVG